MNKEILLSCPLCGGVPEVHEHFTTTTDGVHPTPRVFHTIQCSGCELELRGIAYPLSGNKDWVVVVRDSREAIIGRWNHTTPRRNTTAS